MEIILTRDSLHINEDVDAPHTRTLTLEKITVEELYKQIKKIDYLPRFNGIETWAIVGYSPISVIAHQWGELLTLMNSDMLLEIELKRTNKELHLCCYRGFESKTILKVLENYTNVRHKY